MRTGGSGAIDTACSATQGVHLQLGHVLQPGDTSQLQVERVHHYPGKHIQHVEDEPCEEGEDMVAEDHVVNNSAIRPGYYSPWCEDAHGDQPGLEPSLLLQSEGVQGDTGGDEQGHGSKQWEQSRHQQEVSDMMVSYVNKVKGEDVVTSVAGPRLSFFQHIDIEDGEEPSPDWEEDGVEGDVPSATGQICVERILD